MKPLIVFDLDEVLANNDHRVHWINDSPSNWDKFYSNSEVAKDKPIKPIIAIYRHFCNTARVEIWTGRDIKTQLVSRKWLQKHGGVLPAAFRFRPSDSRYSNLDLKRSFLKESKIKPSMVFDGQPGTSEFWHRRGIQVCYCVSPE